MREIHQVLPAFVGGDAIGNFARQIQRGLLALGCESRIYAASVEPAMLGRALRVVEHRFRAAPDSGLIYHHSIGSALTDYVVHWPGSRLMVYHNITPGCLLRPHNAAFADLVDRGRRALPGLARGFHLGVGVSEYNRRDLHDAGFARTAVLPIPLEAMRLARTVRREVWPAPNGSAGAKLLFVGRMMPHKCPDVLLEWFAHFQSTVDPAARLALVGGLDERFGRFNDVLIGRVRSFGGAVRLAGRVDDEELVNWYRWADAFVSFSAHEGFMVPLAESMAGDTVVIARGVPAVRETLGGAGIAFDACDFATVSGLVGEACANEAFRAALLRQQRARLRAFGYEPFLARLAALVEEWMSIVE